MAEVVQPPAYTSVDVQLPSYSNVASQVAVFEPDVKQPLQEERTLDLQPIATSSQDRRQLATVSSSLQPFSKLRHPSSTPIPEDSWNQFVSDLRNSVAPSGGEKALAILAGTGVTLGCCAPFFGACVGGLVWKKAIERRVRDSLDALVPIQNVNEASASQLLTKAADGRETITQVVNRYNTMWSPLGVCVRLEGIPKKQILDELSCQCSEVPRQSGCGRGNSCGGRRCRNCGMLKRKHCGRLRNEVRREILRVIVEAVDAQLTMAEAARSSDEQDLITKEGWVELKGY